MMTDAEIKTNIIKKNFEIKNFEILIMKTKAKTEKHSLITNKNNW